MRITKARYYLNIADAVSDRGTCLRRRFGAVIIKNDELISTGYAGSPRGRVNCCDIGECYRQKHNIPRGTQYEACRSVHGEANAIMSAGRDRCIDATLYLSGREVSTGELVENASCCEMCRRMVINSGIKTVIINDPNAENGYREINVYTDWVTGEDTAETY